MSANQDARQVVADVHARYFGAELNDQSLTPGDNPRIGPTAGTCISETLIDVTTIKRGTNTSFGSLKQVDAGVMNDVYAEAGPTDGLR